MVSIQKQIVTSSNWTVGREGKAVTGIVLHTMVGTTPSAYQRFNDPSSQVSVHYGVSLDGSIHQWVEETNTAYQAGNWPINLQTIGIEHEDNGNYNDAVRTPAEYQSSSDLVADICRRYNLPCDTNHIFRHHDVIDTSAYPGGTACPDGLDTNKIIAMAKAKLGGGNDMIPDQKHLDMLFQQFEGRNSTTNEQGLYVGKVSYTQLLDTLTAQQAYKDFAHAQTIGVVAVRDNWQGQIANLQAEVTALGTPAQLKPGIYKV